MKAPISISRTKQQELRTYKAVGLSRALKSAAGRKSVEKSGVFRVLGKNGEYLQVPEQRYRAIRLEVTQTLLREAKAAGLNLPSDVLLKNLKRRIETMTYDRLAAEQTTAAALESTFIKDHGREPTRDEKERFTDCLAAAVTPAKKAPKPGAPRKVIDGLLAAIEAHQAKSPVRYQTAWAEAVGPEIASQSCLEKIDPNARIAFFRCFNSALSYTLQREPRFAKKLGQVLKQPIKQLKPYY